MNKQIFKVGDRVFDIRYGWGTIKKYNANCTFPIGVQFDRENIQDLIHYLKSGKDYEIDDVGLLSFTEYDLVNGGFSQERPINYEDYMRKWGKFWNDNPEYFTIGILKGYEQGGHKPFQSVSLDFQNFKPLTDEQIKILELE